MAHLSDIFDVDLFHDRVEQRYVSLTKHAAYPYTIANYTQSAQYDREWDEVTLNCRGLIFNHETLEVVARPFQKFFNFGEVETPTRLIGRSPDVVASKADGSLGIVYPRPDRDGYDVATRGSFGSTQALWATDWLNETMGGFTQPVDVTTLCEIIFPENRIVVNYNGAKHLVCLGAIHIKTGLDIHPDWWSGEHVETFDFDSVEAAAEFARSEHMDGDEGIVVLWRQENEPSFRLKVKHPEYVRLHRILTGTTARSIWDAMRNDEGGLEEFLQYVPDEFYSWVESVRDRLNNQYDEIMAQVNDDFNQIVDSVGIDDRPAFAKLASQCKYPGFLFLTLDGNFDKLHTKVWYSLRPEHEIPFVNGDNGE